MKIEVRGISLDSKAGTGKKSGKQYSFVEQAAFAVLESGEVRKVFLTVNDERNALPVGFYQPKASAFFVGQYGDVKLSMRGKDWERIDAVRKAP